MFSDDGGDRWSEPEPVTGDPGLKAQLGGVYWLAEPFQWKLCFVINNGSTLYFGQLLPAWKILSVSVVATPEDGWTAEDVARDIAGQPVPDRRLALPGSAMTLIVARRR